MASSIPDNTKLRLAALAVIFAIGIFLRITPHAFVQGASLHAFAAVHPQPAVMELGFDEGLYREYVNVVIRQGVTSYPDIVQGYIGVQQKLTGSILPPLRFLYIFTAYCWHCLFGTEALQALYQVAAFFSMLTLVLATAFAWRVKGPTWAIAIAALMAFAPTQIHMSQHALVDGFFTFWALLVLWFFWENLQHPRDWRWLAVYVLALALLVLTKENSFFVWVALVVLILSNRWLQFGTTTRELVVATVLGPLLGVVILIFLAGGIDVLIQTYRLSVSKNFQLEYAVLTGDGPWYRYLVDLLLVSPIILLLAFGTLFRLNRSMKPELFMSIFIAASYVIMCNIKYGMNLRYTNMWDMPLRFLAFSQLVALTSLAKRYQAALTAVAVALIAAFEFRQYLILAVQYPLYEMATDILMRALHILKYSTHP